ncbi:hypothetical protein Trydic_g9828 [Trypoxylus dichotomus]
MPTDTCSSAIHTRRCLPRCKGCINIRDLIFSLHGRNRYKKQCDLTDFINERCQLLETIENKGKTPKITYRSNEKALACVSTERMPVESRLLEVRKHKLCGNCLRPGHLKTNCRSGGCKRCGAKHNSALHTDESKSKNPSITTNSETNTPTNTDEATSSQIITCHQATQPVAQQILLATGKICLQDANGKLIQLRALLDSGSMSNFITHDTAKKLKLKQFQVDIPITGINNSKGSVSKTIETNVFSLDRKYKSIERFLLVNAITSTIPNTSIDLSRIQIPNGISLAGEDFHKAEEVQVLLGASIFFEVLYIGQIKFEPNKPIWQKARFGWVISGPYSNKPDSSEISCNLSISTEDLHKQVERF